MREALKARSRSGRRRSLLSLVSWSSSRFASSLRAKRSNPFSTCGAMDCFAALAMTSSSLSCATKRK
ncbi:MAG: hypothetical protein C0480_27650 [Bradyrhizobium sp.]|nr:hypothetical protein [Bradyrhizobium sp.]